MNRNVRNALKKSVTFYTEPKADERTTAIYMRITFACQRVSVYTHCRSNRHNARNWRQGQGQNQHQIERL